jgi:hypothetical protein
MERAFQAHIDALRENKVEDACQEDSNKFTVGQDVDHHEYCQVVMGSPEHKDQIGSVA